MDFHFVHEIRRQKLNTIIFVLFKTVSAIEANRVYRVCTKLLELVATGSCGDR